MRDERKNTMSKKELKLHPVVSPTETVVVSAYDEDGKAITEEFNDMPIKLIHCNPLKVDNSDIKFHTRIKKRASKVFIGDEDNDVKEIFNYGSYLHHLLELVDLKNIDLSFIKDIKERGEFP